MNLEIVHTKEIQSVLNLKPSPPPPVTPLYESLIC